MAIDKVRETDLYGPVKALLESQGYEVKGEIGAADLVAVRGDEPPVIVELKTQFSLALFHQAIDRQSITDVVYVAVPHRKGKPFQRSLRNNKKLCRRLGVGLMTVRLNDNSVQIHFDPTTFTARKSRTKRERLLKEFAKRTGDPNIGGTNQQTLMTAYRQDALRCLQILELDGPTKASIVASTTGVDNARNIMADNHYGWFVRVKTGIYALTPEGTQAVADQATAIIALGAKSSDH